MQRDHGKQNGILRYLAKRHQEASQTRNNNLHMIQP